MLRLPSLCRFPIAAANINPLQSQQFADTISLLNGIVVLVAPTFEASATGYIAKLPGTFAGVAVSATLDLRSKGFDVDGMRYLVNMTAANVVLKDALKNVWLDVPKAISDPLSGVTFPSLLSSTMSGGGSGGMSAWNPGLRRQSGHALSQLGERTRRCPNQPGNEA